MHEVGKNKKNHTNKTGFLVNSQLSYVVEEEVLLPIRYYIINVFPSIPTGDRNNTLIARRQYRNKMSYGREEIFVNKSDVK